MQKQTLAHSLMNATLVIEFQGERVDENFSRPN